MLLPGRSDICFLLDLLGSSDAPLETDWSSSFAPVWAQLDFRFLDDEGKRAWAPLVADRRLGRVSFAVAAMTECAPLIAAISTESCDVLSQASVLPPELRRFFLSVSTELQRLSLHGCVLFCSLVAP
jgi:hypothetical protein